MYIETECLLKGKREETLKREGVPNIGSNNQSKETIFKNILIVTLVVHAWNYDTKHEKAQLSMYGISMRSATGTGSNRIP